MISFNLLNFQAQLSMESSGLGLKKKRLISEELVFFIGQSVWEKILFNLRVVFISFLCKLGEGGNFQ